jgi:hypothetical protein
MRHGALGDGDILGLATTIPTVAAGIYMSGAHQTEEQSLFAAETLIAGLCKISSSAVVSCSIKL